MVVLANIGLVVLDLDDAKVLSCGCLHGESRNHLVGVPVADVHHDTDSADSDCCNRWLLAHTVKNQMPYYCFLESSRSKILFL